MLTRRNMLKMVATLPLASPLLGSLVEPVQAKPVEQPETRLSSPWGADGPAWPWGPIDGDIKILASQAKYQYWTNPEFRQLIYETVSRLAEDHAPRRGAVYRNLLLTGNHLELKSSSAPLLYGYCDPRDVEVNYPHTTYTLTSLAATHATDFPFDSMRHCAIHWYRHLPIPLPPPRRVQAGWGCPLWVGLDWEEFGEKALAGEYDSRLKLAALESYVPNGRLLVRVR